MIYILGGGLTGLSAAFSLSKQGKEIIVIEKNALIGGLAKTVKRGNFFYDYGPHRFHTKNKEILYELNELVGKELLLKNRKSKIYLNKKFIDYPLKVSAIFSLSLFEMSEVAFSYLAARIAERFAKGNKDNFETFVIARFGKKLYNIFFKPYTEKVWGMDCKKISSLWATQRIQITDPISAFVKMVFRMADERTAISQFYYPINGIGDIAYKYAEKVALRGGKIITNANIKKIEWTQNKINEIIYFKEGKENRERVKFMISTIPLPILISLLNPEPPKEILDASKKLYFRSSLFVFLAIKKKIISENHWIYFPQKEIEFGRISEMKNFSPKLYPKGKTGIVIEYFCNEGEGVWVWDDKKIITNCLKDLNMTIGLDESFIEEIFIERVPYTYPIYTVGYEKYFDIVVEFLRKFDNLIIAGRNGLHRYNNMDHAIEMGKLAAENVLGKKSKIENVGINDEYFEANE